MTVIKVENLSKQYRLGQVSTGTISHDVNRWWHSIRGKEDPYLKIGEENDRTVKGSWQWAVGNGQFPMGNLQWAVCNGQFAMGNLQWAVCNGQFAMRVNY